MMPGVPPVGSAFPPSQLVKRETEFDVVIQGGGINGAATAEELSRRGLKVALVEMNDIGAGTTAYSSRLIHGGLRYLEPLKGMLTPWRWAGLIDSFKFSEHVGLVRESLREREILLHRAPHLVRPLPLGLPTYDNTVFNQGNMRLSMLLYDKLSFDKTLPKFKTFTRKAIQKLLPGLAERVPIQATGNKPETTGRLQGGAVYYDAQAVLPERLALEYALAAQEHGATIFNHTRVDSITTEAVEPSEPTGRFGTKRKVAQANRQATGVRATDLLTGENLALKAKVVINATGSWVDDALAKVDLPKGAKSESVESATPESPSRMGGVSSEFSRRMGGVSSEFSRRMGGVSSEFSRRMGGTKGSHILVRRFNDALKDTALSFFSSNGRHMFIEPFNRDYLLIGTTDLRYEGDPGDAVADRDELQYMVDETNRMFPDAGLKTDDILWVYSGVRPLPYAPPGTKPGQITRKHIIEDHSTDPQTPVRGLVSLIGGKITTARGLAEETARHVIEAYDFDNPRFIPLTNSVSLPGGRGIGKGKLETYKAEAWKNAQSRLPWLTQPRLEHLIDLYGSRYKAVLSQAQKTPDLREPLTPGSPNIAAQVVYAARQEMAGTVSDVMRRTGAVLNETAGLDEVEAVGRALQQYCGWPEAYVRQGVQEYRDYVAFQNRELWALQNPLRG